jgi:hypothetical protein
MACIRVRAMVPDRKLRAAIRLRQTKKEEADV